MTGRGGGGSERHTVYAEMLGWSAALPISAMWRHIHTHMGEMSGTSPCGGGGTPPQPPYWASPGQINDVAPGGGGEAQEIVFQKIFL